jgi:hypothetical protein
LILAGIVVGAGALVTTAVPLAAQIVDMMLLSKFEAGSGLERLYSTGLAAQDFIRYPLLGAGWHNVNCTDLVFLILANTGLIGLIAFGSFLLPILRGLWVSAKEGKLAGVLLLSGVTLIVVLAEAAGLTYAAGYIWLVFGLGAGAVIAARGEPAIEIQEQVGVSHQQRVTIQTAEGTC